MADQSGFASFARAKFETLPDVTAQPCIYKVPEFLLEANKVCYPPCVVSIGPLYYKHPSVEDMQVCKLRCLKYFLEHDSNSYKLDLEHYLMILTEMEGSVRNCYADTISLSSDEFNGMVLVDSAFIICFFLKYHPLISSASFLNHMHKRSLLKWGFELIRDLLLEENQIPFFVLQRLFQDAFVEAYPSTSFLDLACSFLADGTATDVHGLVIAAATIERIKRNKTEIAHLLDLLRNFSFPSILRDTAREPVGSMNLRFPPNVSSLSAAGVSFVASKSKNLLDITFSKGVLYIPPFKLWDTSESHFRSMILFEQSHQPVFVNSYFGDYTALLEFLIQTPEDVQILVKSRIIDNWIGSEEAVAKLFNGINKHMNVPHDFYYFDLCEQLNAHANARWNQWKAILKKNYFSHPWAAISVIYALVLFVLTLAQTIGTFTAK